MHMACSNMIFISKQLVGCLLAFSLACLGTTAQAAECNGLKVATGPAGKGYARLFADMQQVCGRTVAMCELPTSGGLDNLHAMSANEADIGFAQVDTWADMQMSNENIAGLQAVLSLNFNYLHVVVAANGFAVAGESRFGGLLRGKPQYVLMERFSSLRGQRVAVVGSTALLGRKLEQRLRYGLHFVDVETDDQAFQLVTSGKVAAALTVSGWPSGTVGALKPDDRLSLAPFDAPSDAPYVVRPVSYRGLGVYNTNMLAAPNVLLSRPFKGAKASQVAALKACVASHMLELQEDSYSPGWKEIKSLDKTWGIPPFKGAVAPAKTDRKK